MKIIKMKMPKVKRTSKVETILAKLTTPKHCALCTPKEANRIYQYAVARKIPVARRTLAKGKVGIWRKAA